jgi:hypothetical protein
MLRLCFLVNVKTYSNVFNVIGRAFFLHCLDGILKYKTPAGELIPIALSHYGLSNWQEVTELPRIVKEGECQN